MRRGDGGGETSAAAKPHDNVAALGQGNRKWLKNSVRLADSSVFSDVSGDALIDDQTS
jgi:hypothetical protein